MRSHELGTIHKASDRVLLNGQIAGDFEFLNPFSQCGAGDSQKFCGLNLISFRFEQGLNDQFPFKRGNHFEFDVFARTREQLAD